MKRLLPHTLWTLLPCAGLMAACVADDEMEDTTPQIVVEGWIENGGHPVVLLGVSCPLDAGMQDIGEYVIRWGKVTLSDGTNSVVLTGGYDPEYFPPYKYTSYQITGEAGKTYTLTAEYRGQKVAATTTIPHPVQLDSLRAVRSEEDHLFYIKAFFEDQPEEQNYYALFSKRQDKDKAFLLSSMGVFSDEVVAEHVAADVYRGASLYAETDQHTAPYFEEGDIVHVKLYHIDAASFRFWQSYSNLEALSSNMFFPYTNALETNIQGGKGYWCGYGTSTLSIRVQ